ncbi:MAG TPA: LamG-like jellyroll fold domain-containing protein [Verrucomicrobiae bacterium]|nr:LamG-like jellyroll fold domain-containing protein [Verrucomicrobiae bacterium]
MKKTKIIMVLAAISFLNFTLHAQGFITNGLVAYYPFNGNANDASGNGNNGSVNGATLTSDRFGNTNSAYNFNGVNSYIGFSGVPTSQVDNWTITAWVNPASFSPAETIAVGMGYDDGSTGDGYSLGVFSGQLHAVLGGVGDFDGGFTFPATNKWYQIVMLRSSGVISFYVNGVQTPSTTTTSPTTPTAFRIGSNIGVRFFDGSIDDVRIYDRALATNEVAQLYAIEDPGPKITSQPTNVTVNIGDTASFSVAATGITPLSYQWLKDGVVLPNATNATLTLTNIQPPRIGNYVVAVSDTNGYINNSSPASLSISNIYSGIWQGLVAYYPFNGTANDASGNGNNGTVNGATLTSDRFGNTFSAYSFNGVNSYIGFSGVPTSQVNNWTMTAWVKLASLSQSGTVVGLGYDDGITANGYSFTVSGALNGTSPGNQLFGIIDGIAWFGGGFTFSSASRWYQVVMERSSGVTTFFVNGAPIPGGTAYTPPVPTAFRIGSNTGIRFFNGAIDDVRIYNRALSSTDVTQLYLSEEPPHDAVGTAIMAGTMPLFVVGVNIVDGGAGYTNTPLVHFYGGGGSGAQAVAVVSNGVVVAINMTSAGTGYTNAPQVFIDPPFISDPILGIAPVSSLIFSNLTIGSNYQLQQFHSTYWINQSGSFMASNGVYTQVVAGVAANGEYRLALAPVPVQAMATPQVVNGFVVGATVTVPGSGYFTPPNVKIISDVGSNATAVASINGGSVTGITITDAGIGYTNMVTIQIDPPPTPALSPTKVLFGMQLNSSSLVPFYNYQVQFEPDLDAGWSSWNGGLFSPNATTNSQVIFTTNSVGFFRLQNVP